MSVKTKIISSVVTLSLVAGLNVPFSAFADEVKTVAPAAEIQQPDVTAEAVDSVVVDEPTEATVQESTATTTTTPSEKAEATTSEEAQVVKVETKEEKKNDETYVADPAEGVEYAADRVIVTYKNTVDENEAQKVVEDATAVVTTTTVTSTKSNGTVEEEVKVEKDAASAAKVDTILGEFGGATMATVETPADKSVAQTVDMLASDPSVESVEPDYILSTQDSLVSDVPADDVADAALTAQLSTNDPYNPSYGASNWHLGSINVNAAWDKARANNTVGVAVFDTGVNAGHADLRDNVKASVDVTGTTVVNSTSDDNGHGTHVCGIVGARSNNGIGVSGVAYNPNLVVADIYDGEYAYTSDLAKAYTWLMSGVAAQYNVRVVNISFGAAGTLQSNTSLGRAIDNAYNAGILTVVSAGNASTNAAYMPSDYSTCISVVNLGTNDTKYATSNYGSAKDVCAPGYYIYSTYNNGGYTYMTGTSQAAPVVSGVLALEFAANPSLSAAEARTILESTTTAVSGNPASHGKVNASAAVAKASGQTTSPSTSNPAPTPTPTPTPAPAPTPTVDTSKYCTDVLGAGSGKAYTINTKLGSGRLIDIAGGVTSNGGNANMYQGNETPAQRYYVSFNTVSGNYGYYTIKNVKSNRVLDVSGGSTACGANVQQWDSNGTGAQQWALMKGDGGFYEVKNVKSGRVLDVSGNNPNNGANLQIYDANNTSAQRFHFSYCNQNIDGNAHVLKNVLISSRVVDVAGASTANGANINLYNSNGTVAQKFYFQYNAATGYYTIKNIKSGKVIDVSGAGVNNGSNIQQYTSNGTWAQQWSLKSSIVNGKTVYTFYCACNGRCFDLANGQTGNGNNIWCWDANGTSAQKWEIA